jgi:hypothetical protein
LNYLPGPEKKPFGITDKVNPGSAKMEHRQKERGVMLTVHYQEIDE